MKVQRGEGENICLLPKLQRESVKPNPAPIRSIYPLLPPQRCSIALDSRPTLLFQGGEYLPIPPILEGIRETQSRSHQIHISLLPPQRCGIALDSRPMLLCGGEGECLTPPPTLEGIRETQSRSHQIHIPLLPPQRCGIALDSRPVLGISRHLLRKGLASAKFARDSEPLLHRVLTVRLYIHGRLT